MRKYTTVSSIWLAFLILLSMASGQRSAEAVNPLFFSRYDGSQDRLLATSRHGEIREADFFLFLVALDHEPADLLDRYLSEPLHERRLRLRERLHEALENYLLFQASREMQPRARYPRDTDGLAERAFVYPVYDLVWTDRVLRLRLGVKREDLLGFYKSHPELFAHRETVRTRVIFRRLPNSSDTQRYAEAENLLADLRSRVAAGEPFAELAAEHSQAPSARNGGLLPSVAAGAFFAEFDDVVDELTPGEVSDPFLGPGGLYLVRLEERLEAHLPAFDDIREEIEERLKPHLLRYRHTYELDRLAQRPHRLYRPAAWYTHNDNATLVEVEQFRLTVDKLQRWLPDIVQEDCLTDEEFLGAQALRVFKGEILHHECRVRRLLGDPRLARARQMAPDLLKFFRRYNETVRSRLRLSTGTLEGFFASHQDRFEALPKGSLLKITHSLPPGEDLTGLERFEKREAAAHSLLSPIDNYVARLKAIDEGIKPVLDGPSTSPVRLRLLSSLGLDEADPADAGPSALSELRRGALANAFEGFDTPEARFARDSSYLDDQFPPEGMPDGALDDLRPYDVIGPVDEADSIAFWVCESLEPSWKPQLHDIFGLVIEAYYGSLGDRARQELLDQVLPGADVTWLYGQLPYAPRPPRIESVIRRRVVADEEQSAPGDQDR